MVTRSPEAKSLQWSNYFMCVSMERKMLIFQIIPSDKFLRFWQINHKFGRQTERDYIASNIIHHLSPSEFPKYFISFMKEASYFFDEIERRRASDRLMKCHKSLCKMLPLNSTHVFQCN